MTRKIHLIKPAISSSHVMYDGKLQERNRHEYNSWDVMVNRLPRDLRGYNPNQKARIYFEGYSTEEKAEILPRLSNHFKKVYLEDSIVSI
ncbi:hypothetical protein J4466_03800 [Candidatus Pacearchaeota archaeon]|nr:hypothetical protein [Candidatus Pacearchaeota archaeon]